MAIKKIQIKPPDNSYADVLHPETDSTQVLFNGGNLESTASLVPYVGVTTNSGNAYTVTLPTLITGSGFSVKFNADSTGAVTLNTKSVKKTNGIAVSNIKANGIYTLRYDGTNFILQGSDAAGNATPADILSGKTASTDLGDITGTIPTKTAQTYTPTTTDQIISVGQYLGGIQTIKGDANLIPANILSGKGIFGVNGEVVAGKRYVSGSYNISGSTLVFSLAPSGSKETSYIAISGLTFLPSIIKVYNGSLTGCTTYSSNGLGYNYGKIFNGVPDETGRFYLLDGTKAYVNENSFRLPFANGGTVSWEAWE